MGVLLDHKHDQAGGLITFTATTGCSTTLLWNILFTLGLSVLARESVLGLLCHCC